jgi:hypothetical protein
MPGDQPDRFLGEGIVREQGRRVALTSRPELDMKGLAGDMLNSIEQLLDARRVASSEVQAWLLPLFNRCSTGASASREYVESSLSYAFAGDG